MCVSASASLKSFFTNFVSAGLLVYFGNPKLFVFNLIVAIFSIYTSFMQLIDYLMWIDLDCSKGTNKFASIIGPFINLIQPVIIFLVAICVFKYSSNGRAFYTKVFNKVKSDYLAESFSIASNKMTVPKMGSLIYIVVIGIILVNYYSKMLKDPKLLCSTVTNGSLVWKWLNSNYPTTLFYLPVAGLNFVGVHPTHPYTYIILAVYFVTLFISTIIDKSRAGELWCFTSNCIPLLLLIIQKIFKNKLDQF